MRCPCTWISTTWCTPTVFLAFFASCQYVCLVSDILPVWHFLSRRHSLVYYTHFQETQQAKAIKQIPKRNSPNQASKRQACHTLPNGQSTGQPPPKNCKILNPRCGHLEFQFGPKTQHCLPCSRHIGCVCPPQAVSLPRKGFTYLRNIGGSAAPSAGHSILPQLHTLACGTHRQPCTPLPTCWRIWGTQWRPFWLVLAPLDTAPIVSVPNAEAASEAAPRRNLHPNGFLPPETLTTISHGSPSSQPP